MVHGIFLNSLNHNFLRMSDVNLLIVDECHHAVGKSVYVQIFNEHYTPIAVSIYKYIIRSSWKSRGGGL
jgi:ERCC4-related helicase